MPKVTEQYREARRDEIAEAALRCFAAKGFRGASMSDIIAESGLSAGAIYGHFESKQQITMAAATLIIGDAVSELESLGMHGAAPAPSVVVATMLHGLTAGVHDTPLVLQVWGESMTDPDLRELVVQIFTRMRAIYARFFTAWATEHLGVEGPDADAWATALTPAAMGLAHGYIVQSALFEDFDRPAYMATIRELLPS